MKRLERREFIAVCGTGVVGSAMLNEARSAPAGRKSQAVAAPDQAIVPKTFVSGREDGRFVDTAGFIQAYIKAHKPKLQFNPDMDAREFPAWREKLRQKVLELMAFPEVPPQPPPKRIWILERDGYQLQRWEAYPEPYSVVPYLLLVPDGVSAESPAPAVICLPGYGSSKESLAGEPELDGRKQTKMDDRTWRDNRMALHYVRAGLIALAMDNPAMDELESPLRDMSGVSLCAIWAGRNYLGISVFQKDHLLHWLAGQSFVDRNRIAVSGHSLGSDPADILGLLNPDLVKAVVHNDSLCDWREMTIAMNAASAGVWHVVPGMYAWFDAPDIQAALAPRPLLFTEGGRVPHINRVRAAYEMLDASENVEVYFYDQDAPPKSRPPDDQPIPEGLTREEYRVYANIKIENHRFHPERAVPWLKKLLE